MHRIIYYEQKKENVYNIEKRKQRLFSLISNFLYYIETFYFSIKPTLSDK
jgi:hypothetical protein